MDEGSCLEAWKIWKRGSFYKMIAIPTSGMTANTQPKVQWYKLVILALRRQRQEIL